MIIFFFFEKLLVKMLKSRVYEFLKIRLLIAINDQLTKRDSFTYLF